MAVHLSTSVGRPFGCVAPRRLTMKPPTRPAYVSAVSAAWPWYIHSTDDGSAGPGPALAGTCEGFGGASYARQDQ